ncbi:MAG TPA: ATP-dependent DNA helicase RecG [Clostridiales bacterium]|nr:ATP-dependent DNA helicase RecG [Clostridiales bacterium]
MIIYRNSALGFRTAVEDNCIVEEIEARFMCQLGRRVPQGEKKAWTNSLRFMETSLRRSRVPDDCGVLIEYNIPSTSKRVDFIISGHDEIGSQNFVIIELKQWDRAEATDKEALVTAFIGGRNRETIHPAYQAYSYKKYLTDINEAIYTNDLKPQSGAFLHNYRRMEPEPLLGDQYRDIIQDTPVFFSGDVRQLEDFIRRYVGRGRGMDILYMVEHGRIKPSRKFVEYVADMFDGRAVYTLLDEQKVAYSNILRIAETARGKVSILINGAPGTGKSVVAMNAFVALLKRGKNLKFVAPNAAFKNAMVDMLAKGGGSSKNKKTRLNTLFSGSSAFADALPDEFDVLIVDEAHRLKRKGAYMYRGESQVEDVIRAARVSVFFIDDNQRIRPNDEGTTEKIREAAVKFHAQVMEVRLEAQFRCAGAEGFLNWVDHTLQIADTANFDGWDGDSFEFEIMDTPQQVYERIREKNGAGFKARMLAGYAWPWTPDNAGNPNAEIPDISIPEHGFQMPWNSRTNSYSWAIDNARQDQVGCIHTSQGLEFDYAGVMIGNDLRFDNTTLQVIASYDDYYDTQGKKGLKNQPEELTRLIRNIYRVLLSRGMKGCYVFCRDTALRDYMRSRLKR